MTIAFRHNVEKGGTFEPEADRYHLYVSYGCPYATRALLVRKLKGLESIIPITVVSPRLGDKGWVFASVDDFPGAEEDPLYNFKYLRELYLKANPDYDGRVTVPVLWDKKKETIVNNESAELVRILNSAFNGLLPSEKASLDLYPAQLRAEIDKMNEFVVPKINSGVYKPGLATTQEVYDKTVLELFEALDKVEQILTGKDYLVSDRLTEADILLWTTIIRFDPVYVGHFKCNIRTIRDGYPAIHAWMQKLYWNNDAFKSSTDFDHIKVMYYGSKTKNPSGIIPLGPIPLVKPLL